MGVLARRARARTNAEPFGALFVGAWLSARSHSGVIHRVLVCVHGVLQRLSVGCTRAAVPLGSPKALETTSHSRLPDAALGTREELRHGIGGGSTARACPAVGMQRARRRRRPPRRSRSSTRMHRSAPPCAAATCNAHAFAQRPHSDGALDRACVRAWTAGEWEVSRSLLAEAAEWSMIAPQPPVDPTSACKHVRIPPSRQH
jgi:hypothetical protein